MKPEFEAIVSRGYMLARLDLPPSLAESVRARDWERLDHEVARLVSPGGLIFARLREISEFSSIEFIISIRSSRQEPDEDGIWHDDGSRVLAFSLSLTLDPAGIEGGVLELRRRSGEGSLESVRTPPFGTMIIFATGHQGFEHKINRVSAGERLIIAGWCS